MNEAIGRNRHTVNNDPYSWKDNPDIKVETYANSDGTWSSQVKSRVNNTLSTNLRTFPDEESASFWARKQADIIIRKTTLTVENKLREVIRSLIKEIYTN